LKTTLADPNNSQARKNFNDALNSGSNANRQIMQVADDMRPQDKKIGDITADFKNKTRLTETKAPEMVKKSNPSQDPIMNAAQQVQEATAESIKKSFLFPEQKSLLSIADGIAEQMELLSKAVSANSKTDMIEIARKLAAMIADIQRNATEVANKCTDPTLKAHLLTMSKVPKNFATQLKIIAAVKATGKTNDPSAAMQLYTCAQGLANSVIQTVKASESASLKCPKN